MAGKSGRTISIVPEKSLLKRVLSWEGALVVVFIGVLIMGRAMSAAVSARLGSTPFS